MSNRRCGPNLRPFGGSGRGSPTGMRRLLRNSAGRANEREDQSNKPWFGLPSQTKRRGDVSNRCRESTTAESVISLTYMRHLSRMRELRCQCSPAYGASRVTRRHSGLQQCPRSDRIFSLSARTAVRVSSIRDGRLPKGI